MLLMVMVMMTTTMILMRIKIKDISGLFVAIAKEGN